MLDEGDVPSIEDELSEKIMNKKGRLIKCGPGKSLSQLRWEENHNS